MAPVTGDDIRRAYDAISRYVRRTPVVQLDLGGPVTLKLEQLQCAGSFKARGLDDQAGQPPQPYRVPSAARRLSSQLKSNCSDSSSFSRRNQS